MLPLFHVLIKNAQNKHKKHKLNKPHHIVWIMIQMEKLMCCNDICFATSKAADSEYNLLKS
jgi:hypothetical protein